MQNDEDDLGTVRWFGDSWGAPVNDERAHVEVPVGRSCTECSKPIDPDTRGMRIPMAATSAEELEQMRADGREYSYFHLGCFLRSIGVEVTPEVLGDDGG